MTDERARARALRETATSGLEDDHIDELRSLLRSDNRYARRTALDGLRAAAETEADALVESLSLFTDLFGDPDREVRNGAAIAFVEAARIDSGTAKAHLSAIEPLLDDEYELVRKNALDALSVVARTDRESTLPYVDAVADLLDSSDRESRRHAALILGNVSIEHPESVVQAVPGLIAALRDGPEGAVGIESGRQSTNADQYAEKRLRESRKYHRNGRLAAGHAVYEVAKATPEPVAEHVDEIVPLLSNTDAQIRTVAADTLFALARGRPAAVAPYRETLAERLAEETFQRALRSVVQSLAAVSADRPDTIGPIAAEHAERLQPLLDADDAPARGAATALLALAAERDRTAIEPVEQRLSQLAAGDDAKYVRAAAADALERD